LLPGDPGAATSLRLHVPLPARAHQSFGLYTVRERGRAPVLSIRQLNDVPATMRAAVAISPARTSGRITTFTVLVAIDDLRAARTLSSPSARPTFDLVFGSKRFPALSQRGVTGTCPQPGFGGMVKAARAGFGVRAGRSGWRTVALQAVDHARRWCTTDPLLESQSLFGFSATDVAVARLNTDAFADLVVLEKPHTLRGYIGHGNGTFTASFSLQLPAVVSATSITAVTGAGGRSDFYVTDAGGPVQFVRNVGGSFVTTPLSFAASHAVAGNFEGTGGANDVAFVNARDPSIFVLLDERATPDEIRTDTVPSHVTAGDFNGDGKEDIAAAGPAGVSIATGDGEGDFVSRGLAVQQPNLGTILSAEPTGGNPNLVVATSNGVLVVDFSPDLSYSATRLQAGASPVGVALADVTGDGRIDVLALDHDAATLNTWVGAPNAYRTPVAISLAAPPTAMAVGRFNGDARADVAVATEKGVEILLGR
jgi:hypothetical protein